MKLLILTLLLLVTVSLYADEKVQKTITMSTIVPEEDALYKKVALFMEALSKEMDIPIVLVSLPPKRGTLDLRNGAIDGEVARVARYNEKVPGAIMVPEPVSIEPYLAYTWLDSIAVDGWESLKLYSFVEVRGYVFVDTYMNNFNVHKVNSIRQAFDYLKVKRAEVFVMNRQIADTYLMSSGFELGSIRKIETPIDELKLYSYFSAGNELIAQSYNNALIAIKKNGRYNEIFK
ncbi:MAG: hypothetical protein OCC49_01510 [Fibrobacterales bacterium]